MKTLCPIDAPWQVSVAQEEDGVHIRFVEVSYDLQRASVYLMFACLGLLSVAALQALYSNYVQFWMGLILTGMALTPGIPLFAKLFTHALSHKMVKEIRLGSHHLDAIGQDERPLVRWNVHDLEEVWASKDALSPILAVRGRDGRVQSMRVESIVAARWMVELLNEWRVEKGTVPDAETERLLRSVARVGQAR